MPNDTVAIRFRNVFVLCTGRCGSETFVRACEHFTNYNSGPENLSRELGVAPLDYPAGHIEADNRLSWILGRLERRFGDNAFYVHLKRDPAKVAASYDLRWDKRNSLIDGYNRSILMQCAYNPGAAANMVDTITANIDMLLVGKPHIIEIDIDAALSEFDVHHNQSGAKEPCPIAKHQLPPWELVKVHEELVEAHEELVKAHQRLKSEMTDALSDEREKRIRAQSALKNLEAKFKRFKVRAGVLASPMLLVLSPIWLPLVLVRSLRRKKKRKKTAEKQQGRKKTGRVLRGKRQAKTLVYDAFLLHHTESPEAALQMLGEHEHRLPPGTRHLFEAMSAEADKDWLDLMNKWAAARELPKLRLDEGNAPRFHRINFSAATSVPAPHLVTVIMPCFNSEDTIERAVRSVLDQSWQNLEVIAVNDASTDHTGRILAEIASNDSRVKVLHNRLNVGPYVSKNRALMHAQGCYVTGHDADDIALPDRIAKQMAPIISDPECKATIHHMIRLDQEGNACHLTKISSFSFDGICRLASISLLIDRAWLAKNIGFWDSVRFGADSELLARVTSLLGPKLTKLDQVLMMCLSSENTLTGHQEHGISPFRGLSTTRTAYRDAWRAWHDTADPANLFLDFPEEDRTFAAPDAMVVSTAELRAVLDDQVAETKP